MSSDNLDLGPDLPITVYTCAESWTADRIGALALYCSDGRWGEAFDEFCHQALHLPRYDRWAVPGGPAWLATAHVDQSAQSQLDFLVEVHGLERVVLITHFGCAAYAQRLQQSPRDCLPTQTEEVSRAAAVLRRRHPGLRIDGYLAMRRGSSLSFHELGVWSATAPVLKKTPATLS